MFGSSEGEGEGWRGNGRGGGERSERIIMISHVVWYNRKDRENSGFGCN